MTGLGCQLDIECHEFMLCRGNPAALSLPPAGAIPLAGQPPLGGGAQTQKQKNCAQGLKEAKKKKSDVGRVGLNWGPIEDAAMSDSLNPALLGAIAVRESGGRNTFQRGGMGVAIFQIDLRQNPGVTDLEALDPSFSAQFAADMLRSNMDYLAARFPNFTPGQLLQATAASYNIGRGGISGNPATIDIGTAPGGRHGNYGSDILLLMDCF